MDETKRLFSLDKVKDLICVRFFANISFCVLLSSNVSALDCRKDIFENINTTICKTSIFEDDLCLYLKNSNGVPFGNFNALQKELR